MNSLSAELIATQQFDSGRWKFRLERIPVSTEKQSSEPSFSKIALGFTMLSPLAFLTVAYLWARVVG